jgi:hypothetical protein
MKDTQETQEQRNGVDLLCCMVVTAAVPHLETFALNKIAPENAVEVLTMPWWTHFQKEVEEENEKDMGEKTKVNERHTQ